MEAGLVEDGAQFPLLPSGLRPRAAQSTLTIPQRQQSDPFAPREELIDSIIKHESSNNPKARGKAGELGLMQIMPATAAQYGIRPEQLVDPNINRSTGKRYLGDLLKRYKGNEFLALVAYNSGPGPVDKGHLLPQSVKYATRVLSKTGSRLPQGGEGQLPQQRTQQDVAGVVAQQPSMLSRIGSSLSGALEGTAYAGELPALPSGAKPSEAVASTQPPRAGASAPAPTSGGTLPPLPSGMRPLPYGMKMGIHAGPLTMSVGPQETTGEATTQEKLGVQRDNLIKLGEEMQELYDKRLKPKLSGGQLSSTGQGLEYTQTGAMRMLGYENDPDVQDWIVKSGQFSQGLNSYYAASGGGRGGVGYFGEVTSPHVPHPPQGLREVLGVDSPTGQQWDLQKQGDQLPKLIHNLKRDQGLEGQQHYQQFAPEEQQLLKDYGY